MGMSADFEKQLVLAQMHIRVGSAILVIVKTLEQ